MESLVCISFPLPSQAPSPSPSPSPITRRMQISAIALSPGSGMNQVVNAVGRYNDEISNEDILSTIELFD